MRTVDRIALEKSEARKKLLDANPPKCTRCGKVIPKPRRYSNNAKFDSDECFEAGRRERQREGKRLAAVEKALGERQKEELENGLYPDDKTRRGDLYERVKADLDERVIEDWVDHRISDVDVRKLLGHGSYQALGMVRKALFNDRLLGLAAKGYVPPTNFARMLGPSDKVMAALAKNDPAAYQKKLDDLVDAFVKWRTHFFATGRGNYLTKDVHRRWIRAVLHAIYTGSRLMILSPPRHGKTELLIHFCVWQIIRNSEIRILWIGPNTDIAENCLGQVKNLLETHDDLIRAYLAPGQSWAPLNRRTGQQWAADKFTVGTRSKPQKQPTMWAAGVEGKLQSLDADFIVVDDPADPDKSYTPGGRARIDNWFKVKLLSRKMDHTGLAMISSRVHVLDLFAQFLDNPRWAVIIDKAHDQGICGLDLHTDHTGLANPNACVLFPEMNPLRYLREQHDDVGESLFEMMYLNQPRPDGTLIFDPDIIRLRCLHPGRDIGTAGIVGSYRLIAGLDPAAKGVQASFLWAVQEYVDPDTRRVEFLYHMVDMETQQGGGLEGAEKVMRKWKADYGCHLWVVEDNSFQGVFFTDLRFKRFLSDEGITMKPTSTSRNKFDKQLGVSSLAGLCHDGKIIMPYGTLEARRKTDQLIRQMVAFTGETGPQKAGKSDILMSAWFPFASIIRRWLKEARAAQAPPRDPDTGTYPGYTEGTYDDVPWPEVGYG